MEELEQFKLFELLNPGFAIYKVQRMGEETRVTRPLGLQAPGAHADCVSREDQSLQKTIRQTRRSIDLITRFERKLKFFKKEQQEAFYTLLDDLLLKLDKTTNGTALT